LGALLRLNPVHLVQTAVSAPSGCACCRRGGVAPPSPCPRLGREAPCGRQLGPWAQRRASCSASRERRRRLSSALVQPRPARGTDTASRPERGSVVRRLAAGTTAPARASARS